MKRNAELTAKRPDPVREAVGLPVGPEGCYFVGEGGCAGQGRALVCTSCDNIEVDESFMSIPKEHECPKCGAMMQPDIVDYKEPPGLPSFRDYGNIHNFTGTYPKYEDAKNKAVTSGAQPGLWCQWIPDKDGTIIIWDGGEKFYEYVSWLRYIIKNFLEPWGYTLNGQIRYRGEDWDDQGYITVTDNEVAREVA